KITYYRAYLNIASTNDAKEVLKFILLEKTPQIAAIEKDLSIENKLGILPRGFSDYLPAFKTKDKFDIVAKLAILGDKDAQRFLNSLAKTETGDDAKRYAYAAQAGVGTKEAKEKYFNDFLGNKEISESWIESAFVPLNSTRHSELTLPYLEKALAELPNLKRNRKIFFVNGWLAAFIGGQKDEQALQIV